MCIWYQTQQLVAGLPIARPGALIFVRLNNPVGLRLLRLPRASGPSLFASND
jgi:hypothetical protein